MKVQVGMIHSGGGVRNKKLTMYKKTVTKKEYSDRKGRINVLSCLEEQNFPGNISFIAHTMQYAL